MQQSQTQKQLHVCLVGHPNVGKTSLAMKFAGLPGEAKPHTEIDSYGKQINIKGQVCTLMVSTLPGKRINELTSRTIVKIAEAIIYVCDVNDFKTLTDIEVYHYELKSANIDKPSFILANKADQRRDESFPFDEVARIAKELGMLNSYEVSAKDSKRVAYVFNDMIQIAETNPSMQIKVFREMAGLDNKKKSLM